MVNHSELGKNKFTALRNLKDMIDSGQVSLGGNRQLKIYGKLTCSSGKRMQVKNRVFFYTEEEAVNEGFRPCGHCMRKKYMIWKTNAQSALNGQTPP